MKFCVPEQLGISCAVKFVNLMVTASCTQVGEHLKKFYRESVNDVEDAHVLPSGVTETNVRLTERLLIDSRCISVRVNIGGGGVEITVRSLLAYRQY
jgi:hypothetical protein